MMAGTKALPGLNEEETEQYNGLQDARKNKDAPGGAGHLTDSERLALTELQKKIDAAKDDKKEGGGGATASTTETKESQSTLGGGKK